MGEVYLSGPRKLSKVEKDEFEKIESEFDEMEGMDDLVISSLASYVMAQYEINEDAKETSYIEDKILEDLRALNGEYDPEDAARINGGSRIFMNITATKCRAAASWIKDILMSAKEKPWSLRPTALPELPASMRSQIDTSISKLFEDMSKTPMPAEDGSKPAQKGAAETIKDINEKRRDFYDAVMSEVEKEATFNLLKMDRNIEDQLTKGEWEEALDMFIEDFVSAPVALMKSTPAVKKTQTYREGKAIVEDEIVIKNIRVSPLDIFPSPSATDINDGFLCEHIRLSYKDVADLKKLPGYDEERLDTVLEQGPGAIWMQDSGIETEKADLELRGDREDVDRETFHGLHCFGTIPTHLMKEWGVSDACLCDEEGEHRDYIEGEIVLLNNEVVKAGENKDPLGRKPYYKASYQNVPGSWWGRSLPSLMRAEQRMCNACARALANNMGYSSGPIMGLNIDRLADDGDITMLMPLDIVQFTNDPTGNSGKPIEFFQIPSIAGELMAVYNQYEQKADDATGIPRYAYGNEKVGGAAQTAQGLSMLMESATKSIKDAIRHIDTGLITPRIERQFYYNLLKNPDINFSGDVEVVAIGSSTLTLRGAEQARRNEFLQITNNPMDQQLMGAQGRAALLRELGKDLGLSEPIVPDRMEIKEIEEKQKEQASKIHEMEMMMEKEKLEASYKATDRQISGQEGMAMGAQQLKAVEIEQKAKEHDDKMGMKAVELKQKSDSEAAKNVTSLQNTELKESGAENRQVREVALTMSGNKITEGI